LKILVWNDLTFALSQQLATVAQPKEQTFCCCWYIYDHMIGTCRSAGSTVSLTGRMTKMWPKFEYTAYRVKRGCAHEWNTLPTEKEFWIFLGLSLLLTFMGDSEVSGTTSSQKVSDKKWTTRLIWNSTDFNRYEMSFHTCGLLLKRSNMMIGGWSIAVLRSSTRIENKTSMQVSCEWWTNPCWHFIHRHERLKIFLTFHLFCGSRRIWGQNFKLSHVPSPELCFSSKFRKDRKKWDRHCTLPNAVSRQRACCN